jgi:hypothetical protein
MKYTPGVSQYLIHWLCHLPYFLNLLTCCLLTLGSSQAFWLRFEGDVFIISEDKMSQDKKTAAETKLTEEEKVLEKKSTEFVESIAKTNTKKITKKFWKACLKILMIVTAMMWRVGAKTLKIGPGDQVMQSSGNQLSNRVILII